MITITTLPRPCTRRGSVFSVGQPAARSSRAPRVHSTHLHHAHAARLDRAEELVDPHRKRAWPLLAVVKGRRDPYPSCATSPRRTSLNPIGYGVPAPHSPSRCATRRATRDARTEEQHAATYIRNAQHAAPRARARRPVLFQCGCCDERSARGEERREEESRSVGSVAPVARLGSRRESTQERARENTRSRARTSM